LTTPACSGDHFKLQTERERERGGGRERERERERSERNSAWMRDAEWAYFEEGRKREK